MASSFPLTLRPLFSALLALLLFALVSAPARADEAADRAALDQLFLQLHEAPDEATASVLAGKIWSIWISPADPDLALRMMDVMEARATRGIAQTIELLDALIADYPAYAEGWNQRATMHYINGDYGASIADCGKVLELEPRHFGALSGRAMMYLQLGKRALALRDIRAALALHPYLAERALFPELSAPITRT
jgi:tetratricopeptide (TPR) repeat protein